MAKKINNKQFMLITVFWFILTMIILWVLSGGCTSFFVAPSDVTSSCITNEAVKGLNNIPLLGLFLPFTPWVSLLYWFAPVAGFVFSFFVIRWWNEYFETKEATTFIFPLIMILILLIGFMINLTWYYGEFAANSSARNAAVDVKLYFCFENSRSACDATTNKLNTELQQQAVSNNSQLISQYLGVSFWPELRGASFLTFIIGAISAWKLLFFKRIFEERVE